MVAYRACTRVRRAYWQLWYDSVASRALRSFARCACIAHMQVLHRTGGVWFTKNNVCYQSKSVKTFNSCPTWEPAREQPQGRRPAAKVRARPHLQCIHAILPLPFRFAAPSLDPEPYSQGCGHTNQQPPAQQPRRDWEPAVGRSR